jgi:hypothetical protein
MKLEGDLFSFTRVWIDCSRTRKEFMKCGNPETDSHVHPELFQDDLDAVE